MQVSDFGTAAGGESLAGVRLVVVVVVVVVMAGV